MLSEEAIAEIANINRHTVRKALMGNLNNLVILRAIANALAVEWSSLFEIEQRSAAA